MGQQYGGGGGDGTEVRGGGGDRAAVQYGGGGPWGSFLIKVIN